MKLLKQLIVRTQLEQRCCLIEKLFFCNLKMGIDKSENLTELVVQPVQFHWEIEVFLIKNLA